MRTQATDEAAMSPAEVAALLNVLLESERAGARVLAAYVADGSMPAALQPELTRIQRDEAGNCAVLLKLLRRMGADASMRTGGFHEAALWIEGARARLEFLNRGQAWVVRRLAAALPRIAERDVKRVLEAMHDSHLENIALCDGLLARLPD